MTVRIVALMLVMVVGASKSDEGTAAAPTTQPRHPYRESVGSSSAFLTHGGPSPSSTCSRQDFWNCPPCSTFTTRESCDSGNVDPDDPSANCTFCYPYLFVNGTSTRSCGSSTLCAACYEITNEDDCGQSGNVPPCVWTPGPPPSCGTVQCGTWTNKSACLVAAGVPGGCVWCTPSNATVPGSCVVSVQQCAGSNSSCELNLTPDACSGSSGSRGACAWCSPTGPCRSVQDCPSCESYDSSAVACQFAASPTAFVAGVNCSWCGAGQCAASLSACATCASLTLKGEAVCDGHIDPQSGGGTSGYSHCAWCNRTCQWAVTCPVCEAYTTADTCTGQAGGTPEGPCVWCANECTEARFCNCFRHTDQLHCAVAADPSNVGFNCTWCGANCHSFNGTSTCPQCDSYTTGDQCTQAHEVVEEYTSTTTASPNGSRSRHLFPAASWASSLPSVRDVNCQSCGIGCFDYDACGACFAYVAPGFYPLPYWLIVVSVLKSVGTVLVVAIFTVPIGRRMAKWRYWRHVPLNDIVVVYASDKWLPGHPHSGAQGDDLTNHDGGTKLLPGQKRRQWDFETHCYELSNLVVDAVPAQAFENAAAEVGRMYPGTGNIQGVGGGARSVPGASDGSPLLTPSGRPTGGVAATPLEAFRNALSVQLAVRMATTHTMLLINDEEVMEENDAARLTEGQPEETGSRRRQAADLQQQQQQQQHTQAVVNVQVRMGQVTIDVEEAWDYLVAVKHAKERPAFITSSRHWLLRATSSLDDLPFTFVLLVYGAGAVAFLIFAIVDVAKITSNAPAYSPILGFTPGILLVGFRYVNSGICSTTLLTVWQAFNSYYSYIRLSKSLRLTGRAFCFWDVVLATRHRQNKLVNGMVLFFVALMVPFYWASLIGAFFFPWLPVSCLLVLYGMHRLLTVRRYQDDIVVADASSTTATATALSSPFRRPKPPTLLQNVSQWLSFSTTYQRVTQRNGPLGYIVSATAPMPTRDDLLRAAFDGGHHAGRNGVPVTTARLGGDATGNQRMRDDDDQFDTESLLTQPPPAAPANTAVNLMLASSRQDALSDGDNHPGSTVPEENEHSSPAHTISSPTTRAGISDADALAPVDVDVVLMPGTHVELVKRLLFARFLPLLFLTVSCQTCLNYTLLFIYRYYYGIAIFGTSWYAQIIQVEFASRTTSCTFQEVSRFVSDSAVLQWMSGLIPGL